jgi:two-component system chemotaxis response regulator CheY
MSSVWLIDDDEEMNTAVSLMLKLIDYETECFLDATIATQALQEGRRPALILLDINLPKISGKDFLVTLRKQQQYNDLPVLMLSSEFADSEVDEFMRIGADGYVFKPVTIEEMQQAIEKAIAKHSKAM